jgi:hypothetical protein
MSYAEVRMSDDGQPRNPNATMHIDAADAEMLDLDDASAPMIRRSLPPPLPPEAFLPLPAVPVAVAPAPARGLGRGALIGLAVASVLGIGGGLKFGLAVLRPASAVAPAAASVQAAPSSAAAVRVAPSSAPTTMQMPAVDLSEDDAGK